MQESKGDEEKAARLQNEAGATKTKEREEREARIL